MISLRSTPIANTTSVRISLTRNNVILATLDPDESSVLTLTFDGLLIANPPRLIQLSQTSLGSPVVQPGMLAYLEYHQGYVLRYSRLGLPERSITFG